MQPFSVYSLAWLQDKCVFQRTSLFRRAYRDAMGSETRYAELYGGWICKINVPSQTKSPVLKPIITSRRSDEDVDIFTSWQVGCAEKVILDRGSYTYGIQSIRMKLWKDRLGPTFVFEPASAHK